METRTARTDDPSAAPTAYVTAIFVVVFVIVVLALQAYFGRVQSAFRQERVLDRPSEKLARARAEQLERITGYRWVDREAGVVAIPIERAMELTAAELARGSAGN